MTTEKCHSVCLLVYDIIFFSPKNRPCALDNNKTIEKNILQELTDRYNTLIEIVPDLFP